MEAAAATAKKEAEARAKEAQKSDAAAKKEAAAKTKADSDAAAAVKKHAEAKARADAHAETADKHSKAEAQAREAFFKRVSDSSIDSALSDKTKAVYLTPDVVINDVVIAMATELHESPAAFVQPVQPEQTPEASPACNQAPWALVRPKRWGDGVEAPAAGKRHFVPHGFVVTYDIRGAIERCGHSSQHVEDIMQAGRAKASTATTAVCSETVIEVSTQA